MNRARICLPFLAVLGLPVPALADFETALAAYERGDTASAQKQFSVLAAHGDAGAQYNLAMLYLKRPRPDYENARPWLKSSAESGFAPAQYVLGMLTYYGVGAAKDEKAGLRLLESSMKQGDADAKALVEEIRAEKARAAKLYEQERLAEKTRKAKQDEQARLAAESRQAKQDEQERLAEKTRQAKQDEQARLAAAASQANQDEQGLLAAELAGLHKQLEQAKTAEKTLASKLAHAEKKVSTLESEREKLRKTSTTQQRTAKELGRERAALQARLSELEAKLAAAPEVVSLDKAAIDESVAEQIVSGRILDVVPGGILLTDVSRHFEGEQEARPEGSVVFVHLLATNGIVIGKKVEFLAELAAPYAYRLNNGAMGSIPAFRVLGERPTF